MKNRFEDSESEPGEDENEQSRMAQKKEYIRRERRGWILSLLIAIVVALSLRFFVFEFIRVDGPSMEKTLYTDDYVFMEKVTYWFRHPAYGDIVICSFPDSTDSYVKRVIGTPGDKIKVKDGVLYINGVAHYDYSGNNDEPINNDMDEITVPADCVFVMGDHRNASRDSRDPSVGPIPYNKILGKSEFVIWPLDQIHGL
jgi:signal peptidase I